MNTKATRAMILTAGLLFAVLASSQEKKIKRSDLPPAVEKTVAAQSAGATVKGISKENEKGQTYYEAEMIVNGHTKDIQIDTSGAIVKVETITKKDKLVAYEAQVTKGAKKLEVQVGPNGKPLDHEE